MTALAINIINKSKYDPLSKIKNRTNQQKQMSFFGKFHGNHRPGITTSYLHNSPIKDENKKLRETSNESSE